MAGKRSNGEGSITYDKRRKRYRAKVTIGWEENEETGRSKQIVKTLGSNYKTKGEATAALAEYLKTPYDLNNKDITFSQLYELWFPRFVEKHESQRYHVKSAYKYCSSLYNKKVREITIVDMKDCIYKGTATCVRGKYKGEQRPSSPSTKEYMKMFFNNIFAFALESRIIDRNYAKDFSLDKEISAERENNRKIKNPFTQKEIDKLWKSADIIPFADMILYACYSGWRPTELIKLRVKNVHLEEGYIEGGIKTDAGKNRLVPIHHEIKHIVEKYYNEAIELKSEYLFNDKRLKGGKKTTELSRDQYLSRFNKVMNMLNFGLDMTPHCTRHTFVTYGKKSKIDEYILKRITGHKIYDVTEHVYTHREIEELKEEMNKIIFAEKSIDKKSIELKDDKDKELYEMYLKLKEKFED